MSNNRATKTLSNPPTEANTSQNPITDHAVWILFGLALIGLLLRLAPLLRDSVSGTMDSERYIDLARGLKHGCGLARRINGICGDVETLRTPGYPLFLAVMPSSRFAIAVQGVLGAEVSLLIGLFVWTCWGLAAGAAAELLVALDIPSIVYGAMIMSDILFQAEVVAGIVLALWIIWRGQSDCVAFAGVLIAAVLFAMATMVRPLGIVLPLFAALPAVLLPRLSWRRAICMALLAFAISSSTPFAWIARNVQRTGVWILSTDGPIDLYYYKAAGIRWYRGNKSYPAVQDELGRELGWPMQQFTDVPPSLQHEMIRRALKIILHDPVASANMTLRCLGWLAIVPERGSLDGVLGTGTVTPYSSVASASRPRFAASGNVTTRVHEMLRSPLLTALVAVQCVTMIFVWTGVARALVGLGPKPTLERRMILIPFLLAIAFLGLSAGAESVARYRIPVMPLLAMIAAVGWFGRFKEAKRTAFLVRPSGDKKMAPSPRSARTLGLSQLSSKTGPTQSIGE